MSARVTIDVQPTPDTAMRAAAERLVDGATRAVAASSRPSRATAPDKDCSRALPAPWPTRPRWSPTTTIAAKAKRRPPFTTFATRLMVTSLSVSSLSSSRSRSRPRSREERPEPPGERAMC